MQAVTALTWCVFFLFLMHLSLEAQFMSLSYWIGFTEGRQAESMMREQVRNIELMKKIKTPTTSPTKSPSPFPTYNIGDLLDDPILFPNPSKWPSASPTSPSPTAPATHSKFLPGAVYDQIYLRGSRQINSSMFPDEHEPPPDMYIDEIKDDRDFIGELINEYNNVYEKLYNALANYAKEYSTNELETNELESVFDLINGTLDEMPPSSGVYPLNTDNG